MTPRVKPYFWYYDRPLFSVDCMISHWCRLSLWWHYLGFCFEWDTWDTWPSITMSRTFAFRLGRFKARFWLGKLSLPVPLYRDQGDKERRARFLVVTEKNVWPSVINA